MKMFKKKKSLFLMVLLLILILGLPRVSSALDVGDKAPEFKLLSTNGKKISLSEFRGKKIVLLEFYAADFLPG